MALSECPLAYSECCVPDLRITVIFLMFSLFPFAAQICAFIVSAATFDVSANLIEGPIPQTVALSTGLGECSHYSHITGHFGPPILSNSHTFQTYP